MRKLGYLSLVFCCVGISRADFDTSKLPDITISAHGAAANWAAASADGLYVASCGDDGAVRIWKFPDLSLFKTISTPNADKVAGEFSPDDAWMAEVGTDGKMNIRKVGDAAGFGVAKILAAGTPDITSMALSDDGSLIAVAAGKLVKVWRTRDYYLRDLTGALEEIRAVAISGDDRYLASASFDGFVYLYDLSTKKMIQKYDTAGCEDCRYLSVALSRDGQYLAYGDYTGVLTVRPAGAGSIIRSISAHARAVTACAVSSDDKYLASGSMAGDIKIWRMGSFGLLKTLQGPSRGVQHISFSPDGKYLLASGIDGTVQLWSLDRLF